MGSGDALNSQAWLSAIAKADDASRVGLIQDFHDTARPVVKRVTAALLREYAVERTAWADDVELLVTETLLALVVDVVAERDTSFQGVALYSVLLTRSRSRFQHLIRGRAHQNSMALAPVHDGLLILTSQLHIDGSYMVIIKHKISGETYHSGPFEDVVESLRYSLWIEAHLAERGDPEWQAASKPLLNPERVRRHLIAPDEPDC